MNDALALAERPTTSARLTAFVLGSHRPIIRPAPPERAWMDATDKRYAYRCLPLNIANAHGWEILCPSGFAAWWSGAPGKDAIAITPDKGSNAPAVSHFGYGVLTFHVPVVFKTDPGVDLYVTGPVNRPKDGIGPLTGIVETDWAPYTFTMNWLITRPRMEVRFEKDEPFCHFFPIERGRLERMVPDTRALASAPDLERRQKEWSDSRSAFNAALEAGCPHAAEQQWQKSYFRGTDVDGAPGSSAGHRSKLRVKAFPGLD